MRILLLFFALQSFSAAHARDDRGIPLCSLFYAKKLKQPILDLGKSDKFAHCALSCQLALRCGAIDSAEIGVLKEIWDMFTPGDADIKDIKADWRGIDIYLLKLATDDQECVSRCDEINWEKI